MKRSLPRLLLLSAGLVLVSGVAAVALSPGELRDAGRVVAAPRPAARPAVHVAVALPRSATYGCDECGVIESAQLMGVQAGPDAGLARPPVGGGRPQPPAVVRAGALTDAHALAHGAAKPVLRTEITIRLQDGSKRVLTDANAARWRRGDRVIVIAGAD